MDRGISHAGLKGLSQVAVNKQVTIAPIRGEWVKRERMTSLT